MREGWFKGVKGLFTVCRVLPPELFDRLMNTNEPIPANSSTPLGGGDKMKMPGMKHGNIEM